MLLRLKVDLVKTCINKINSKQAENIRNNVIEQVDLLYTTYEDYIKNQEILVNSYLTPDLDPEIYGDSDNQLAKDIATIEEYFPQFSFDHNNLFRKANSGSTLYYETE